MIYAYVTMGNTCSNKSLLTVFSMKDMPSLAFGDTVKTKDGKSATVIVVYQESGCVQLSNDLDLGMGWVEVECSRGEENPSVTFEAYDKLLQDTARNYDETDARATDGSHIPTYAALGLAGETGEVVELVKKAMRTLAPMDKAKVAMELGDVTWYIARMANVLGFTFEDVIAINSLKLRRRLQYGKDEEVERKIAESWLKMAEENKK